MYICSSPIIYIIPSIVANPRSDLVWTVEEKHEVCQFPCICDSLQISHITPIDKDQAIHWG